uniref:CUB domain-containing protein n=1 Tax=Panagrolaimus sp. PS1159 TaxID=55785 RepID=A0AC35GJD9_9BILA
MTYDSSITYLDGANQWEHCNPYVARTVSGSSGLVISHHGYGTTPYNESKNCVIMVVAPLGYQIRLKILDFNVPGIPSKCDKDSLHILDHEKPIDVNKLPQTSDSERTPGPIIGNFCGQLGNKNNTLISTHNSLTVWWHTDPSMAIKNDDSGFRLLWSAFRKPTSIGLVISHHGYGTTPYNESKNCVIMVVAPLGYQIRLKILDFNVPGIPSKCDKDSLHILDHEKPIDVNKLPQTSDSERTPGPIIGNFCGQLGNKINTLISTHNSLTVWWHTDPSMAIKNDDSGFRLLWSAFRKPTSSDCDDSSDLDKKRQVAHNCQNISTDLFSELDGPSKFLMCIFIGFLILIIITAVCFILCYLIPRERKPLRVGLKSTDIPTSPLNNFQTNSNNISANNSKIPPVPNFSPPSHYPQTSFQFQQHQHLPPNFNPNTVFADCDDSSDLDKKRQVAHDCQNISTDLFSELDGPSKFLMCIFIGFLILIIITAVCFILCYLIPRERKPLRVGLKSTDIPTSPLNNFRTNSNNISANNSKIPPVPNFSPLSHYPQTSFQFQQHQHLPPNFNPNIVHGHFNSANDQITNTTTTTKCSSNPSGGGMYKIGENYPTFSGFESSYIIPPPPATPAPSDYTYIRTDANRVVI